MNEIGSDFHWHGASWPKPGLALYESHRLAGTARSLLLSIASHLQQNRVWLPAYFCPSTSAYWQNNGLQIKRYLDHPMRAYPDWTTLQPQDGDLVVAVNYFGVRSSEAWLEWQTFHKNIILIEDHTHDPLSSWARSSKANYAFASLRKTLPIPDGALLWSPIMESLPQSPHEQNWNGSALRLAAMLWKKEYVDSEEAFGTLKPVFRRLQLLGDEIIESYPNQKISPWSQELVRSGFPVEWRCQRAKNVRQFIEQFPDSKHIRLLFQTWPEGNCPFNPVLVADTRIQRDMLRHYLITADIFPPIHWVLSGAIPKEVQDISDRILTLPLDHRYSSADVDYVAHIIQEYLDKQ